MEKWINELIITVLIKRYLTQGLLSFTPLFYIKAGRGSGLRALARSRYRKRKQRAVPGDELPGVAFVGYSTLQKTCHLPSLQWRQELKWAQNTQRSAAQLMAVAAHYGGKLCPHWSRSYTYLSGFIKSLLSHGWDCQGRWCCHLNRRSTAKAAPVLQAIIRILWPTRSSQNHRMSRTYIAQSQAPKIIAQDWEKEKNIAFERKL